MGTILPETFDLRSLRNDEERAVVTAFRDRLNDGWYIIPSLRIRNTYDYELDVVLAHPANGIINIEVKGHRVRLEKGDWVDSRGPLDPQPMDQARKNAYELRNLLRKRFPEELEHLAVHYGVALPNTLRIDGELPPDYTISQILLSGDLADPFSKLQDITAEGTVGPKLGSHHLEAIVQALFPDAEFVWDDNSRSTRLNQRLEDLSSSQIKSMEQLDANRRVVVTGGAGSGKTRLACAWARRALSREERVLFVCFNEPLADVIREHFLEDENLTMGAFLQVARHFDGMPGLSVPADMTAAETKQFWDVTASGHLHANWPSITEQFDTIIIDEAQDFSPAWIAQLDALLDPDGPRRMMMVADAAQDVFNRGFNLPTNEDGWTVCELTVNCRNSLEIAQLLRRCMGGAASPLSIPPGQGVTFHTADASNAETVLSDLLETGRFSLSAAVIVASHDWRERLRANFGLGDWSERHQTMICESVRRLKGTEFDSVIVFDPEGLMDDQQLYVAISRAVNRLDVIGPSALSFHLGLST